MKTINTGCAEVFVSYTNKIQEKDRIDIKSSLDAAKVFKDIFPSLDHVEYCYLLMLNRKNQVLGYHQLSKGGMTASIIDIRVIFQVALKTCANSIMLAHNHPSGNLNASDADKKITRTIVQGGLFLAIPLLDHLIITTESYMSFSDEGLL